MNPYFRNEHCTIYHSDVIEGLRYLYNSEGEFADLVITSPPYNVGKDYGAGVQDSLPYEDYLGWLDRVWEECFRVLRPSGRLCINVNDQGRNPYYPIHADILSRLRVNGWHLMGNIVWDKMSVMNNTAWGSWESASAPSLRGRHEYIIIAGKEGKKRFDYAKRESGPFDEGEFVKLTQEIWKFTPETHSKHPAPFPYELPKRLIKLFSFKHDMILDPFMGSGTTLRAAYDLNRKSIGIDIVEKFCNMSAFRMAAHHLPGMKPGDNMV